MDRNFNRAVTATLKYEGGYVNLKSDPGGATNLGVTIATFRRYVKPSGTIADLKALTVDQAKTVYRRQYWDAVSGAELPDGVDFAVFDFGDNSRAVSHLENQQRHNAQFQKLIWRRGTCHHSSDFVGA